MNENQKKFIDTVGRIARAEFLSREKWVLPSVCIAQAILESGWNLNATTLFGIKGDGTYCNTSEFVNGQYVDIVDSFRAYPNIYESVKGYYDFITETPRYAGVVNEENYSLAVYKLIHTTDGLPYATAPHYISTVTGIIEEFNLTEYDNRENESEELMMTNEDKRKYIECTYLELLGRLPDEDGLNNYMNLIPDSVPWYADLSAFVDNNIKQSEEYANHNKKLFITKCFLELLGRLPDEIGEKTYMEYSYLRDIYRDIYNSDEAKKYRNEV